MADDARFQPVEYAQNAVLRGLIGAMLLLPYRWRVPFCGWVFSRLLAPVAGWDARVRRNLALIWPDLPQAEVRRMLRAVPANVGRTLIELYSPKAFKAQLKDTPVRGVGLDAILQAQSEGRGVFLVSGHFGNYGVAAAVMTARGHPVAALYNPMANRYFNAHYTAAIAAISTPLFARGRRGLAGMVQHIRKGGLIGILIDQHMRRGAALQFMGHRAMTALSAADLALKYNCLLVPVYGLRLPDGISFELIIEAPIAHSTAEAMTQALNDSLEAQVRAHPDQWFWIHRRWK